MPANLPPPYYQAEERYRAAKNNSDKLAALEEMLRIMPKHKGTDHLQADIKGRIAKLKKEPTGKTATRIMSQLIDREGAAQVALVGPANSGKSSLVAALTKAEPEVADYPHTTQKALPGMFFWEGVGFQLIDLPPLSPDYNEPWLFDQIRRADLVWLVLSGLNPLTGRETALEVLGRRKIGLAPVGRELEGDLEPGWYYKEAMAVVTGADLADTGENLEIFDELLTDEGQEPYPRQVVSTLTGQDMDKLGPRTFEALGLIRIFTKQPGKEADLKDPFTLAVGATVDDLAARIHKDVQAKFQSAKLWGSAAFDGQVVQRDYVLADGDVVEIKI